VSKIQDREGGGGSHNEEGEERDSKRREDLKLSYINNEGVPKQLKKRRGRVDLGR